MTPNILVLLGAALIPLVVAFIWYSIPSVNAVWSKANRLTEEEAKAPLRVLQLVFSFIFYFMIAFGTFVLTVHQFHIFSLVGGNAELLKTGTGAAFLIEYGSDFITWSHGLAHGFMAFIAFGLPLTGLNAIWEKKGIKYLVIDGIYWLISLVLMGMVISMWGGTPIT